MMYQLLCLEIKRGHTGDVDFRKPGIRFFPPGTYLKSPISLFMIAMNAVPSI